MTKKPTNEELEQRVKELEKEVVERKFAEEEGLLHTVIVENMAEGACLTRASDGVIVYANKTFESMFGYDPGELINKHVSIINAPSEKSPEEIANGIIQSLKEKATWSGEVRNIKKDGTPFWCHANVSTFDHHDFGEVWVSLHQDITKRKQVDEQINESLKEKAVLLKEIHHRVKNNLQIISSLIDMRIMRTNNKQTINVFEDIRSKIRTMALIHTQLYRSERFDRINMGSHAQELVNFLMQVYARSGVSITSIVEHSDVYLSITQAVPCALVLNELVSNAFKHAFKKGQKGTIEVSLKRKGHNKVFLQVKDNGIGIPEEIDMLKTNTLGFKLVRNTVQHQLMGKIHIEQGVGTSIFIEFKILGGK